MTERERRLYEALRAMYDCKKGCRSLAREALGIKKLQKCLWCAKPFDASGRRKKYCGTKCSDAAARMV